jgi:hypothetical protein
MPPKPAQPCKISALPGHAPKSCCARDRNTHELSSAGPHPQGLHSPAQYSLRKPVPLRPAKAGTHTHTRSPFCWTTPPKPVKPRIHRHAGSPLFWPVPFRHTKTMLQRPATSPQLKASTRRPMGPQPLATCHRKAPNLPKRHTQTGLDAKELASEQLRLNW